MPPHVNDGGICEFFSTTNAASCENSVRQWRKRHQRTCCSEVHSSNLCVLFAISLLADVEGSTRKPLWGVVQLWKRTPLAVTLVMVAGDPRSTGKRSWGVVPLWRPTNPLSLMLAAPKNKASNTCTIQGTLLRVAESRWRRTCQYRMVILEASRQWNAIKQKRRR